METEERCYITGGQSLPEKGGGADGKRALDESPALRGIVRGGIAAAGIPSPKSVLTAWQHPSGQHSSLFDS